MARQIPIALLEGLNNSPIEPRIAVRIENENGLVWITSHSDIVVPAGGTVFPSALVSATSASQEIVPERGFSTIGSVTVKFVDDGFTAFLRNLRDNLNDTIYDNRATVFYGVVGLPFADYLQFTPHFVSKIVSDQNEYTLTLDDAQRVSRKTIFDDKPTAECRSNLGFSSGNLTINQESLDRFELVEHDENWTDAPNQTVGYLKVKGVDSNGQQATEWIRYTGKSTTTIEGVVFPQFTGITRGVLGTSVVNIIGGQQDGNTEVEELIYLDLPVGKLLIAVLTGDLFGQAGSTLPAHWHAGVTADFINIESFQNAAIDLWDPTENTGFNLAFYDLDDEKAKDWIADQILRLCNLLIRVDSNGELELFRFDAVPQDNPGSVTLDYESITNVSSIKRDSTGIKNRFQINWEWRPDLDRFVRNDIYIDSDSIARNNFRSDIYALNMKGVRNTGRDARTTLQSLAEGIRARFSDPSVKPMVSALLSECLPLEVGDIVTIDLEKHPDYAAEDTVLMSCEVQSVSFDFFNGTADLKLFGTSGRPTPIEFTDGSDAANINHGAGWTDISTVLTGDVSGNTFTVTANGNLPQGRYFYDGNLTIADGVTVTFNGKITVIDCRDLTLVNTGKLDGKGRGNAEGERGYFGGGDASQCGMRWFIETKGFLIGTTDYFRFQMGSYSGAVPVRVPASRTQIEDFQGLRVDQSGELLGIPADLSGNSGSKAGLQGGAEFTAPGGLGGAGLFLLVENLFVGAASRIDTSGTDNEGGLVEQTSDGNSLFRPASGFGWPGCLVVAVKLRASPLPILDNVHIAEAGAFREALRLGSYNTPTHRPYANNSLRGLRISNDNDRIVPRLSGAWQYGGTDVRRSARRVRYLAADVAPPRTPGVDRTGPAALPIALSVQESQDTPKTPLGDQSTLTLTVTPPDDDFYSHALFEYRVQGQPQWFEADYGIRNETTIRVTSNGLTYEIRAKSVSRTGQISTAFIETEYTVFDVVSQIGGPELGLPDVYGLSLDNRIAPNAFNEFKSGNAEFSWQGRHANLEYDNFDETETGLDSEGRDLIFRDYQVTIRGANGSVKRVAYRTDESYAYTLEDNRRDGTGRAFDIEVVARGNNGQTGKAETLSVENPAPEAPSNVSIALGHTSFHVEFTPPDDIDFVGFDFFVIEGSGDPYASEARRLRGNSVTEDGLIPGSTYTIGLRSVDQFGDGDQIAALSLTTRKIDATELGDITSPLTLDENGGRIITNNDGFIAVHGAHSAPDESALPLIFSANDGVTYSFWVDAGGNAKFAGELSAASGTFAGTLQAAGGVLGDPLGQFVSFQSGALEINTPQFVLDDLGNATYSGQITGAFFQSSATGNRFVIDSGNNEVFYENDAQSKEFRLTPATSGDVSGNTVMRVSTSRRAFEFFGEFGNRIGTNASRFSSNYPSSLTIINSGYGAARCFLGRDNAAARFQGDWITSGPSIELGTGVDGDTPILVQGGGKARFDVDEFDIFRQGSATTTVTVGGDFSVSGTKNFNIPHPTKPGMRLIHGAYEGPIPGGNIYRESVTVENGSGVIEMPDWFAPLNRDVDILCQPVGHFGMAYAECSGNSVKITANSDGEYLLIIFGTRQDSGVDNWQGIERKVKQKS